MNNADLLFFQEEKFSFIKVAFSEDGPPYTYKTVDMHEVGDKVVVDARGKLKVVEVVEVDTSFPSNQSVKYKWVVSKVDTTTHDNCVKVEEDIQDKLNNAAAERLKKDLLTQVTDLVGVDGVKALEVAVKEGLE